MKSTRRGKGTRRRAGSRKQSRKILEIPELRKGMHHITSYGQKLVSGNFKSVKVAAIAFAAEWKRTFGKALHLKAAEQYIRHIMGTKGKTRKQRGGMAPIGYVMGPGGQQPYGVFQNYVAGGFQTPEPGMRSSCGTEHGDIVPPSMGSNKVGGGLFGDIAHSIGNAVPSSLSAIGMRPFAAENPVPLSRDVMTSWKGQGISSPGPNSYDTAYQYRSPSGISAVPTAQVINRVLGNDISR
jgi:hypothetical protein